MTKYEVQLEEVHNQSVVIEANSAEEAVRLVLDGNGEERGEPVYSYTIDTVYGALNLETLLFEAVDK
jgi:hypothetical protein